MKIPSIIDTLEFVITMENLLLEFLPIRQQTTPLVETNSIFCKKLHCLKHLPMNAKVKEEATLGVDEVGLKMRRNHPKGVLRF
jgi:hypothetical protein